jgi:hypothetical protein
MLIPTDGRLSTLSRQIASSIAVVEYYGRYYEGLLVVCPLELKREFDNSI